MHIDFDPNNVDWHHLIQPTSVDKQFGGGAGYTPFAGLPYAERRWDWFNFSFTPTVPHSNW